MLQILRASWILHTVMMLLWLSHYLFRRCCGGLTNSKSQLPVPPDTSYSKINSSLKVKLQDHSLCCDTWAGFLIE